jgi:CBS domain containing-hemolysin-like protein
VVLLLLSAVFSSAETALTTVNKIRIRTLADEGNKRAKTVLKITDRTSKMLTTVLIGNNIVNLTAASLTTSLAYSFGGRAVAIASGILTFAVLIFGEIVPKTMASLRAEKLSLAFAPVLLVYIRIMTPVGFILNGFSYLVLRILGYDPHSKNDAMTESELRTIVDVSHEDGVIESGEKEMINNVFDLGDAKAKDIMVPRVHVTFADIESTFDELLAIFREDKYTRLPVFKETTDNVVGTINMKDLLLFDNTKEFHVKDILREAYFTYEYKSIPELLVEMREASINIAIVLDEYGDTSGLITLEDILEEIVGEIHDEYDENEEDFIQKISDTEYLTEASVNLEEFNDRLGLSLSSEDYDSLGGYIIEQLDRFPEVGDIITTPDKVRLEVKSLDKNRVQHVLVTLPAVTTNDDTDE